MGFVPDSLFFQQLKGFWRNSRRAICFSILFYEFFTLDTFRLNSKFFCLLK